MTRGKARLVYDPLQHLFSSFFRSPRKCCFSRKSGAFRAPLAAPLHCRTYLPWRFRAPNAHHVGASGLLAPTRTRYQRSRIDAVANDGHLPVFPRLRSTHASRRRASPYRGTYALPHKHHSRIAPPADMCEHAASVQVYMNCASDPY